MQVGGFFAVEPKEDCPHVDPLLVWLDVPGAKRVVSSSCCDCEECEENWMCLGCGSVACSRYKNGHMSSHNESYPLHALAFSLADLSCWCYQCESYIVSPSLRSLHSALYEAKFGEKPPTRERSASSIVPSQYERYPDPLPVDHNLPEGTSIPEWGHPQPENPDPEYLDTPAVLEAKLDELAQLIKGSNRVVSFTGAGISTSADIAGANSKVWTLKERSLPAPTSKCFAAAKPTFTHLALKSLCDRQGLSHTIVSTNVDGLHLESGVPSTSLVELHGNVFKEECYSCQKEFIRDFVVTQSRVALPEEEILNASGFRNSSRLSHATGRLCDDCGAPLCDNIVHFGEKLSPLVLERAELCFSADLSLVLGTSMRLSPANLLPSLALKNGGKMVIISLQMTPFDHSCALRIFAPSDLVLSGLLQRLGDIQPQE